MGNEKEAEKSLDKSFLKFNLGDDKENTINLLKGTISKSVTFGTPAKSRISKISKKEALGYT